MTPQHTDITCTWFFSLLLMSGILGCGQIEAEPVLDKDGDPIEFPPPLENWLLVSTVTSDAETQPLRPSFLIQFNQYLQEDSALSYGVVTLRSGALSASGSYTPIMVKKAILWTPYRDLRDSFEYTLTVSGSGLRSVTEAPTPPDYNKSITFIAAQEAQEHTAFELEFTQDLTWPDIKDIFDQRGCYACHGQPDWNGLNPLTYDAMVGQKSEQTDLQLVRFKDPTNSYLMHKILPDYPVRSGTLQPPKWSASRGITSEALTEDELWLVEQWIRQGARKTKE